jgi:hypothetical protein
MKFFSPSEHWFNYCALLISLFLVKSVVLMSIIPPFEGWDEYQHLAYMSYLDEFDAPPVLNKSFVSRDLLEKVAEYPVSKSMFDQVGATGAVEYKTYFDKNYNGLKYKSNHHDIALYQAQHGSLYYHLMLPVKNLFSDDSFLDMVFTLRFINILFVAVSFASILWLINRIFVFKHDAAAISLLIVCQPLLLINSSRIANDAFSIMIGTWVIIIGLLPEYRKRIFLSFFVGLLMGVACWTKSTAVILFPFWFCCIVVSYRNKEISLQQMVIILLCSNFLALAVLSPYFTFNLNNYGMLFVMQEAIVNKNNNIGLSRIITSVFQVPVIPDIIEMWLRGNLWIGGWSFLKVHNVRSIFETLLLISLFGWIYRYFTHKKIQTGLPIETALLCLSTVFFTSLALSWHYVQSTVAWGVPTTCVWYACISLPFFLIFIYDSAGNWPGKSSWVIGLLLILLFTYTDIRGVFTMASFYCGGGTGFEALVRLSSIHPTWLGTPTFFVCSALYLCLLMISLTAMAIEGRRQGLLYE